MWQALFWELGILDNKQNQTVYCHRAYCLVGKTNNQVSKPKITIVVNTMKGSMWSGLPLPPLYLYAIFKKVSP